MSDAERDILVEEFKDAMTAAFDIFGEDAFRKRSQASDKRRPVNRALFESWGVNLACCTPEQINILVRNRGEIKDKFISLIQDDSDFDRAISYATHTPRRVRNRFHSINKNYPGVYLMLRNIKLTHFKCFEHLELDCTPLNLLCGLNGMGKSSVLQALLVLQQSFETGELSRGSLVLGGARVDLGAGSDVMFENAQRDEVRFSLESDKTPEVLELSFNYSTMADQLSVSNPRSGTDVDCVPAQWRTEPPFGGNMVYVNAERPGPRKSYPLSYVLAVRGDFGSIGEYAWNYLSQHQNDLLQKDDPRSGESGSLRLLDAVNLWLQDISPGVNLELNTVMSADAVIAGFFIRSVLEM